VIVVPWRGTLWTVTLSAGGASRHGVSPYAGPGLDA